MDNNNNQEDDENRENDTKAYRKIHINGNKFIDG
jgi:hypothetical protein